MVTLRSVATALAGAVLLALFPSSQAHSFNRNSLSYVSLIEDPEILTNYHRVHSYSHFDLTFTLHNGQQDVRLSLEPNHDVISDSMFVTRLGSDGKVKHAEPVLRTDHRVYKGHAYTRASGSRSWSHAGWARISVDRDGPNPLFDGSFRIHGDTHQVQTAARYHKMKLPDDPSIDVPNGADEHMVVWRASDIRSTDDDFYAQHSELKRDAAAEAICDADSLTFNSRYDADIRGIDPLQSVDERSLLERQDIDGGSAGGGNGSLGDLASTIGDTAGCPTTRKVALVGIATDCTYWGTDNAFADESELRKHVVSMVNQASEVYESTFNISLGIANLTVNDADCPGSASASAPWNVGCSDASINDRLNLFSAWRGEFNDTNAYWSLLTTCNTDATVGLAWRGQLCSETSSTQSDGSGNETVAAANVVVRVSTEWQIFAHETGHIFGAVHDCTSQTCPSGTGNQACCPLSSTTCDAGGKFIMNPSTGEGITQFSPCSIGFICSGMQNVVDAKCLTNNKDVATITGSECGNGIVEEGEDCDCGGQESCADNACCDPATCKFKSGAVCDPTNDDCCSTQCQFTSSGTVCRPSTGQCDPAETCTGKSPTCPADQHKSDGSSCGDGLKCASGQCTSRDLQCKVMVGDLTTNNDTSACSDTGCLLSCASPDFGANQCVTLNQNYLDGTDCGGGGRCDNGSCKGGTTAQKIDQWIHDHLSIFIPIVVVVGILVLIGLLGCLCAPFRRRQRAEKARKAAEMAQNSWQSFSRGGQGAPPPPPEGTMAQVHDVQYPVPPPPPMAHWNRTASTRYA